MTDKILSPASKERVRRHKRIIKCYDDNVERYETQKALFDYIAKHCHVSYNTAIGVCIDAGRLPNRKKR